MEKANTKTNLETALVPCTKKKEAKKEDSSEISIQEFLDFLRTAYQVTDSVEDTLSKVEGAAEVVNWIKLKNTALVQSKNQSTQPSNTNLAIENDSSIKNKLDDILNEGLLDSVLPYLVPNSNKKSTTSLRDKNSNSSSKSSSSKDSVSRRKSTDNNSVKSTNRTDSEIEIHVCDEVKNVKKDFICSQKLLVEKMGYFAEVTSGILLFTKDDYSRSFVRRQNTQHFIERERLLDNKNCPLTKARMEWYGQCLMGQKLEDMDISVHCDIGIFEWLMSWVKQEIIPEEDRPKLDTTCVIPILVSAAFLQMEPLLQDCLLYCHENMNEILQNATNLSCLNDSIITRLAAMYTNSELEFIKDKKDKIHSRLYCKMIQSLCDPVSESVRGHWNSLARIFKCSKCEQLIMPEIGQLTPCHPTCMTLNRYGQLISSHLRDASWNINDYVLSLYQKYKNWRKVYWYLWGDCHFLFCSHCFKPFPAHKLKWCQYHTEPPQYFTVDSQKSPLPVGRFPCCGERAYKFQLLNSYSGCRFREHAPKKIKPRDAAVYAILEKFRDIIDADPPHLIFPEKLTRLVARDSSTTDGKLTCKEEFWWTGLQIIPQRTSAGLLGLYPGKVKTPSPTFEEEDTEDGSSSSSRSSSSSSCDHSEESCAKSPKRPVKRRLKKKKKIGKLWQMNLSARSNQDLQRSNEEQILSKMVKYLSQKNANVEGQSKFKGYMKHITPPGGIYSRLEAEWKETNSGHPGMKKIFGNKGKIKATRLV